MASPGEAAAPTSAARDSEQPDDGPNKKRRAAPTSRGVANLTPEQLARKRANDREAQRAIRERTKNQIDRLHQRIHDLENQQPYHDLQLVLREKEAVQAENADIKKRLESVLAIIQPILRTSGSTDGLNELAAAAERSPLPVLANRDAPGLPTDARQFHATLQDVAAAVPPTGVHSPAATDPGRPWMYPADGPENHMRRYSNSNSPRFEATRPSHMHAPDMPFDGRLGVGCLLDANQQRVVDPNLPPPQLPQPCNVSSDSEAQYAPHLVAHLTLPRNSQPTCPLDAILLTFLQDRQSRAAEGVPVETLVGPLYPNFTSLVYPDRNVESHPLSQLFTEILRTFPDICGKPEQVAIVFIMFLIMRWQIEPSQYNYDRLPHWVTPRPSQLFVGHPCWIDHLPWPKLRDRLCQTKPFVSFQNFFIPFTTTISLNWPYEPQDVLLPASKVHAHSLSVASSIPASSPYSTSVHIGSPQDPPTPQPQPSTPSAGITGPLLKEDQWLINPAFETHLRDLNNWSLGPSFRSTFPQLTDCVRIKYGR